MSISVQTVVTSVNKGGFVVKKRQTNNRGVTLVELVVALAVLAMLMVAVIMLMSNNTVIYRKTKADISVQTSAQETYSALQDSIMQAKYIELSGYTDADATIKTYKKKSLIADGDASVGFDTLMSTDPSGTSTYTTVYPTKLTVTYSVENSDDIDNKNCTVTYYFCRYEDPEKAGQQKCNVYVSRDYDASTGKKDVKWSTTGDGWKPENGTGSSKEDRDKYQEFLYTQALSEAKIHVDYTTQSFDLDLNFYDRGQKYNTSGVVSCRNSYITKDMRSRTAAEITITETESAEGEGGEGGEGGTGGTTPEGGSTGEKE